MSLHPCKECGQQISTDAKVCPHCGKKQGMGAGAGCLVILGLLVLAGVYGSLNNLEKPSTPPRQPNPAEVEAAKRDQERARKAEQKYLKTPAGRLWQRHKDWERRFCDAIAKHKVLAGMSPQQVRSAWGRPEHINRTVIPGHTTEQWVYGDTYLYFDDGILTSWQDSR